MFVTPAAGLKIRDPFSGLVVPPQGMSVVACDFWTRRIIAGEATQSGGPTPVPTGPYVSSDVVDVGAGETLTEALAAIGTGGGGGGESLFEAASATDDNELPTAARLKSTGALSSLWLKGDSVGNPTGTNSDDSRDAPQNFIVFQNIGMTNRPCIGIGNPYRAGIGQEAGGFWYSDDLMIVGGVRSWALFFSYERTGTGAFVLNGIRHSAVESFIRHGGYKPWMRIEASAQAFTVGSGDLLCQAGNAVRVSGVLTMTFTENHNWTTLNRRLYKSQVPGLDGNVADLGNLDLWGPVVSGSGTPMYIRSIPSANSITVADSRPDFTSTSDFLLSAEVDVAFGRDTDSVAVVRLSPADQSGGSIDVLRIALDKLSFIIGGTEKLRVLTDQLLLGTGMKVASAGTALQLGANDGSGNPGVPCEVTSNALHILSGHEIQNDGRIRSTGWYNGGGQTQTTQVNFIVGGSGTGSTYLPTIDAAWQECRVINRRSGNLTVYPNPTNVGYTPYNYGNTISGAGSIVLAPGAAALFLTNDVNPDWSVVFSPAPS